jgi:hypothetical protein
VTDTPSAVDKPAAARDRVRIRDFVFAASIAFVPTLLAAVRVGNMFVGNVLAGSTVAENVAMCVTAYAIALAAVFLVTPRRRLGIVRRALVATGVTVVVGATGVWLVHSMLSGVHDSS